MRRKNDLARDPMAGLLLRLAIPTMLAQFVNVLYSIVDRMFICHIADVGSLALAGVGVCGPIVTLLSSFSMLVGLGGTPLMALKLGAGQKDEASALLSNCFRLLLGLAVGLSVAFFLLRRQFLWWFGASVDTFPYALEYITIYIGGTAFALLSGGLNSFLIAQGRSGLGMGTVVLGAALNTILDPLFIFVLNMGVSGAAWATVLSQVAASAFALVSLRLSSLPVSLEWGTFRPELCKKVVIRGIAPFLTYALDSVILIIMNASLQRCGGPGEGDLLITCGTIVQSYMLLIATPMSGVTLGCQGVVSFNLGAGDRKRVTQALRGVLLLCLGFATLMLVVTQAFAPLFAQLFTRDSQVLERSVSYIRIYTAATLCMAVQWTVVDMSTALGQVGLALFCSLFRKGLFVSGILIFPLLFTASAAFAAEPFCDVTASILSGILFLHFTPRLLGRLSRYHEKPMEA